MTHSYRQFDGLLFHQNEFWKIHMVEMNVWCLLFAWFTWKTMSHVVNAIKPNILRIYVNSKIVCRVPFYGSWIVTHNRNGRISNGNCPCFYFMSQRWTEMRLHAIFMKKSIDRYDNPFLLKFSFTKISFVSSTLPSQPGPMYRNRTKYRSLCRSYGFHFSDSKRTVSAHSH